MRPMKPDEGRCSLMLWRRAFVLGSSLRFWALRLSKRAWEDWVGGWLLVIWSLCVLCFVCLREVG
jgi:hypothetical protein